MGVPASQLVKLSTICARQRPRRPRWEAVKSMLQWAPHPPAPSSPFRRRCPTFTLRRPTSSQVPQRSTTTSREASGCRTMKTCAISSDLKTTNSQHYKDMTSTTSTDLHATPMSRDPWTPRSQSRIRSSSVYLLEEGSLSSKMCTMKSTTDKGPCKW